MLRSYLYIALRNVRRHAGYTFINVAGLAVGIATCLLILLYVRDELRYDRFHEKADRVYRVVAGTGADGQPTNANGAFSWAAALEQAFPEITRATRLHKMGWGEKRVVAREGRRFYEDRFFFTDPDFFTLFSFPFVAGDPETALRAPNTVVITETTARRYFGNTPPLGEVLAIDPFNEGRFIDFTVTGVVKDVPAASHMKFDLLASFATEEGRRTEGWGFDPVYTYVLLAEDAAPEAVARRLPAFLQRHLGPDPRYTLALQPITEIRLHSQLRAELEPNGDIAYVYIFSAIAALILLVACINFMNLATARATQRAREIGMRKVVGAFRGQLIRQFIGEAMLLSGTAMVLALGLVQALVPVFNAVSGKAVSLGLREVGLLLPLLAGLTLLVGLIAGSYPAFVLSAFRPIDVLQGRWRGGGGRAAGLRRLLVVFQFAVTVVLIACTALISEQLAYVRGKNLGFDREQVLVLPLNDEVRTQYDALQTALRQHPGIFEVAASEQVPARAGNGAGYQIEGVDERQGLHRLFVDPHFIQAYGIEMAAGRAFSEEIASDSTSSFIVNETFVRQAGWAAPHEALGKEVTMSWSDVVRRGPIVGVTEDFQLFSFREAVTPLVLSVMPLRHLNFLSVRVAPEQAAAVLDHLRATWQEMAPRYPFDYYFVDDDFARLHRADAQLGRVFQYFALLAVFIACLGLFGLAAYSTEQRTKEIGIRKVLGASVVGIVLLLSKEFIRLVGVAVVLAVPVSYLAMSDWLEGFVYRITLTGWTFVLAGLAALLVALLTVSYQAVRAARADPVKALRYE